MLDTIHPDWFRDDLATLIAPPDLALRFTPEEDAMIIAAFMRFLPAAHEEEIARLRAALVESGEDCAAHEDALDITARLLARRTRHSPGQVRDRWRFIRYTRRRRSFRGVPPLH